MNNPFVIPMWIMLAAALIVSFLIDIPNHTLIGLWAYAPWAIVMAALVIWERGSKA